MHIIQKEENELDLPTTESFQKHHVDDDEEEDPKDFYNEDINVFWLSTTIHCNC